MQCIVSNTCDSNNWNLSSATCVQHVKIIVITCLIIYLSTPTCVGLLHVTLTHNRAIYTLVICTVCPNKNAHLFVFFNNPVKNQPTLTIFGTQLKKCSTSIYKIVHTFKISPHYFAKSKKPFSTKKHLSSQSFYCMTT